MARKRLSSIEHTLSISEAQSKITQLPEQFAEDPEVVTVTRHGKPVMTILPYETYKRIQEALETIESLQETLEIMQDEELMAAFRQGVQELAEGKGRPWEDVKKELKLDEVDSYHTSRG
jgi:prevent-host-death family protein